MTDITYPDPVAFDDFLSLWAPDPSITDLKTHWTISGDLRLPFFGPDDAFSNHEATENIRQEVEKKLDKDDLAQIQFDSEYSCFFAYADTEQAARKLFNLIEGMYRYGSDAPETPRERAKRLADAIVQKLKDEELPIRVAVTEVLLAEFRNDTLTANR